MPTSPPVLLAAGGTGGHVYPALAIYQALAQRGIAARLVTDARGLRYVSGIPSTCIDVVPSGGLVSGSTFKRLGNLWRLARGWRAARKLIKQHQIAGVIGLGGYASVPPIIAAHQRSVPSLLYQGDAVLGRANAFVSGRVSALCLAFPNTSGVPGHASAKTVVVGAPLRAEIEALYTTTQTAQLGALGRALNVLCVGGSLGAKAFATLVPRAFEMLGPDKRATLHLVQQVTDGDDKAELTARYRAMGQSVELLDYIDDMDRRLDDCDLIIARAGGTTVHECAVAGRPAIFVPLGLHRDAQQSHNAAYLTHAGAAWRVTENDAAHSALADILRSVIENPTQLAHKGAVAKDHAILGAADSIAELAVKEFFAP